MLSTLFLYAILKGILLILVSLYAIAHDLIALTISSNNTQIIAEYISEDIKAYQSYYRIGLARNCIPEPLGCSNNRQQKEI